MVKSPVSVHMHLDFFHFSRNIICLIERQHGVVNVWVADHVGVLGMHLLDVVFVIHKNSSDNEINQTVSHFR